MSDWIITYNTSVSLGLGYHTQSIHSLKVQYLGLFLYNSAEKCQQIFHISFLSLFCIAVNVNLDKEELQYVTGENQWTPIWSFVASSFFNSHFICRPLRLSYSSGSLCSIWCTKEILRYTFYKNLSVASDVRSKRSNVSKRSFRASFESKYALWDKPIFSYRRIYTISPQLSICLSVYDVGSHLGQSDVPWCVNAWREDGIVSLKQMMKSFGRLQNFSFFVGLVTTTGFSCSPGSGDRWV